MRRTIYSMIILFTALAAFRPNENNAAEIPKKNYRTTKRTIVDAGKTNAQKLVLTSLQTVPVTNRMNPEWLKPPTEAFTLGPSDKLEIELLDDITSRQIVNVAPDGKIYYSILPGIDVWGLTVSEAKQAIEKEFAKFLRDKPQVGITVRSIESKRIWMLGRFNVPGVYSNTAPVTLLEAISMAGGAMTLTSAGATAPGLQEVTTASNSEEVADFKRAFVVRKGEMIPVDFERLLKQGDLSQNIYLRADDFVYLPPARAREVYVLGGAVQPRAVVFQQEMTLIGAIASAGGPIKDAYLSHVAVVRGSLSQPQIAIVDYKEIIKGYAPDVALESHDIVYIPLKPYRLINRYAQLIANTFVTTLAINEGTHAVNQNIRPTQIVVPLGSSFTVTKPTTSIQAR